MNQLIKGAIITSAILIGMTPFAFAKFTDLEKMGEDYTKAIEDLMEKGIMNGYPDNTFRPDGKMTRAEFTKVMVTADNLAQLEEKMNFTDIAEHWAREYIAIASSNGMIQGYEDKTFQPDKEITYAEVVAILLRSLGMEDKLNEELDWPQNYMSLAAETGLFDGIMTNDLIGSNPARRDNVAFMLWNQMNMKWKDETGKNEEEKSDEVDKDNEQNGNANINTREKHLGVVTKLTLRRGEDYITVRDLEGNETELKLYSNSTKPQLQSFIVYTLASNGNLKLRKQLIIDDIDEASMLVEEVDESMAQIQGEEKWLDWDLDSYTFSNEKIKLNQYTYYLVEMVEKENQIFEFDTFEEIEKENVHLKKEDRICFDKDTKIALIIRGLE